MNEGQFHNIALSLTRGISCRIARQLLTMVDNAEEIFNLSAKELAERFSFLSPTTIEHIVNHEAYAQTEKEMAFMERNKIRALFCKDADYPQRLNRKECHDTPIILYYKGNANLNHKHVISVVGTRRATNYGRAVTERIISELEGDDIAVISGLAYGIDTAAHQSSLKYHIATVGVLGHGMDILYPSQNRALARQMVDNDGGLITEYPSGTAMHPAYFPARNRIIAAMSDATIVVEAAETGGALLTAGMATGYCRDVFAIPGRLEDEYSKGCNNLIADNKAYILRGIDDLAFIMGWKLNRSHSYENRQQELFCQLKTEEQKMVDLLHKEGEMTLDEIVEKSGLSLPKIATLMLSLDLKSVVKCLAGKKYKAL